MVRAWLGVGIVFVALLGLCGCRKDPPVEVKPQSGLERAKVILNDYAQGVPMASEAMTFQEIVEEVRQTDPQKTKLGQRKQAWDNYHQAVTFFDKLVAEFPHNPDYRHNLARCYLSLGDYHGIADFSQSPDVWEQDVRQAVAFLEVLARESPAVPVYQQDLAKAYDRLAQLHKFSAGWKSLSPDLSPLLPTNHTETKVSVAGSQFRIVSRARLP